jgi:hypothetical protein
VSRGGRRVGDGMLLPHACLLGPAHALGCICCVAPISSAVHECVASTNAPLASVLITFLGLISQWLHLVSTGVIHDKSGFVLPRKRSVEMTVHVRYQFPSVLGASREHARRGGASGRVHRLNHTEEIANFVNMSVDARSRGFLVSDVSGPASHINFSHLVPG